MQDRRSLKDARLVEVLASVTRTADLEEALLPQRTQLPRNYEAVV
jgi:hypothetical protein